MTVMSGVGAPAEITPPPGEDAVPDVRDLRMRYGATDVLTGVTFVARRGEVLVLLGPNGAGKTTTIEILEGFWMRSAGQVAVLGTDPAGADERWRARVGVVLQSWRDHGTWRAGLPRRQSPDGFWHGADRNGAAVNARPVPA
jgi:ABC-2 type transport system ATP-binding protein